MKRMLIAGAGGLSLLLLVLVIVGAAAPAASVPVVMQEVNRRQNVALELMDVAKSVAADRGIPWQDLAAYLRVQFDNRLPIPTRRQLVMTPYPTPMDRALAEQRWYVRATLWIQQHIDQVGTDFGALVGPERLDEYLDTVEAITAVEQLLEEDPEGWQGITEGEVYTPVLALLEWPHSMPVAGATYMDDWGFDRPQNAGYASSRHHGTDMFAPRGAQVVSAGDGTIHHVGWNYLGGRTVTVRDDATGALFYYAHLQGYAPGLQEGNEISRGALIGYVGTSGEGPEGTDHVIAEPHLHFGIYLERGVTNPYPYLQTWSGGGNPRG